MLPMYIVIHKAKFLSVSGKELWFTSLVNSKGSGFCEATGRYDPDFANDDSWMNSKQEAIDKGLQILKRRGLDTGIFVNLPDGGSQAFNCAGQQVNPMKVLNHG